MRYAAPIVLILVSLASISACGGRSGQKGGPLGGPTGEQWFCQPAEDLENWDCVQSDALAAAPVPTRMPVARKDVEEEEGPPEDWYGAPEPPTEAAAPQAEVAVPPTEITGMAAEARQAVAETRGSASETTEPEVETPEAGAEATASAAGTTATTAAPSVPPGEESGGGETVVVKAEIDQTATTEAQGTSKESVTVAAVVPETGVPLAEAESEAEAEAEVQAPPLAADAAEVVVSALPAFDASAIADDAWLIQVVAMRTLETLEILARERSLEDTLTARVASNNEIYYVLLVGPYASKSAADEVAARPPEELADFQLWVRSAGSIKEAMRDADALAATGS